MEHAHKLPFREFHLLNILQEFEKKETAPLDFVIYSYFKAHKALGSKDRGEISETAYALIRWKALIEHSLPPGSGWLDKIRFVQSGKLEEAKQNTHLPAALKCSFPSFLFDMLAEFYGLETAQAICLASNEQAPTTVRVNALKTTRESLFEKWKQEFSVALNPDAPYAIDFLKKIALFSLPEFKEGLFEMQDAASQLVGELLLATPGDSVLDYCSGSGGKSLAIAPKLQGKGQLYLHDVRLSALQEAKKRLKRAGIQNAQIVPPDAPVLKRLKKKMQWVLVDAPCSGTGTFRRNPDMKWRLTPETITRLTGQQRTIFERALSFLAPGGSIVYATCSILPQENEDQALFFEKTHGLLKTAEFKSVPKPGKMDGFYAAVFRRAQENK